MTITLTDEELFSLTHGRVPPTLRERLVAVAPQLRMWKATKTMEWVYPDGRVVPA